MESYGQLLVINNEKLCVNIEGTGDKVIILLPGAVTASPVLEMKPLAKFLSDKFTVITIEYFGYGLSENTKRARTIEFITEEIHCVLQSLGVIKYSIMAHSISGVYGLYYTNKYPNEVEAFIGIDSSVPRQNELLNVMKINIFAVRWQRLLTRLGIRRRLSGLKPDVLIANTKGYDRSVEEAEFIRKLSLKNIFNSNILDELKNGTSNFEKAAAMKFPEYIPVLFFLSTDTMKLFKQWREFHEEIIEGNLKCEIIEFEGTHSLYNQFAQEITEITKKFIGV